MDRHSPDYRLAGFMQVSFARFLLFVKIYVKNRFSCMKRLLLILCLFRVTTLVAQPVERLVDVIVTPDHADWLYKPGEPVKLTVSVYRNNVLLKGVKLRYEIGPEKMEPTRKETVTLKDGTLALDAGTMKTAGFLRCIATAEVDGKEYRGLTTAGFDPLAIKPTVANPADFKSFWDNAKADLAKVPIDARMTLLPERCTELTNVYHLSLQNINNSRFYGILCVPKKEGKYPVDSAGAGGRCPALYRYDCGGRQRLYYP